MFRAFTIKYSKVILRDHKLNMAKAESIGWGRMALREKAGKRLLQGIVGVQTRSASVLVAVGSREGFKHRRVIMRFKI